MLGKGLQWWVMGLNPHNSPRSTGCNREPCATTIPLLQNIYPNPGIISSDSFHLKVYNIILRKKWCSPWFYSHDDSSKSSTARGSQVLNRWSLFWFLLLQLHLIGKQTYWLIDWHASDMAELWAEITAELPMVMCIYWYVLMCHKYRHMVRLLKTSIQLEMCR